MGDCCILGALRRPDLDPREVHPARAEIPVAAGPNPLSHLARPELCLDNARAGSDEGTFLFVGTLLIFRVSMGLRQRLSKRERQQDR